MKTASRGWIIIALVLAVLVTAMAVWLFFGDRSLARVRNTGYIRIGYAIEPPYAYLTPDGDVTGESPELAKRIVKRLDISRIEWRVMEFDMLIPALNAGKIDVIAAGMFITPQRARLVSFSEPTFHVQQGILVAKGNPYRLHAYRQALQQPGRKVAVLSGSVEEAILRKLGATDTQLISVPDVLTGRVAVESGLADCLALSSPALRWMARYDQLGKTEIARPFEQPPPSVTGRLGYGAFAFRRHDRRLLTAWNVQLKKIVGSPAHRHLIERFGFTADELPGRITTKEILSP